MRQEKRGKIRAQDLRSGDSVWERETESVQEQCRGRRSREATRLLDGPFREQQAVIVPSEGREPKVIYMESEPQDTELDRHADTDGI